MALLEKRDNPTANFSSERRVDRHGIMYAIEVDEMIVRQRVLVEALKQIRVVAILEGMTAPEKLARVHTSSDLAEMGRRMDALYYGPPSIKEISAEEIETDSRRWRAQQWQGMVLPPRQLNDGSLDSTLRIVVDNDVFSRKMAPPGWAGPLKRVILDYSAEGMLTIRGRGVTFQGIATSGSYDKEAIETGLVEAFRDPEEVQLPNRNTGLPLPAAA